MIIQANSPRINLSTSSTKVAKSPAPIDSMATKNFEKDKAHSFNQQAKLLETVDLLEADTAPHLDTSCIENKNHRFTQSYLENQTLMLQETRNKLLQPFGIDALA